MKCFKSAAAALAFLFLACGSDARFESKFANEYARGGSVSVFGLFKDGRMNPEIWGQLGASILKKKCDAAYSVDFVALKAPLATAVDDYVRQYGVTDALLGEFAGAAKGDTILVVSMAGRPPQSTGTTTTTTTTRQSMPGTSRRGMPTPQHDTTVARTDGNVFEMSASLYSVRLKRSVALLTMVYDGRDMDAAIGKFGDQLAQEMPTSKCLGWDGEVVIDDARIKNLKEE
jgi:hypothetical protein